MMSVQPADTTRRELRRSVFAPVMSSAHVPKGELIFFLDTSVLSLFALMHSGKGIRPCLLVCTQQSDQGRRQRMTDKVQTREPYLHGSQPAHEGH